MPPRPPTPNTVKLEVNWQNAQGRPAHNICYAQLSPPFSPTDPTFLAAVGQALMTQISGNLMPFIAPTQSLLSVTCSDNTGASDAQGTSSTGPFPGTNPGTPLPPQCAVCLSWDIGARYRGGKPRWYLPGIPSNALVNPDDSALAAGYSLDLEEAATSVLSGFNGSSISGEDLTLGTISFQTGHAPRPTPLFRAFGSVRVHQRLDSQRRRSGKESAFPIAG